MKPDTRQHLRANLLMLIAAMIWGSAFVAQRLSLDAIGPFLFTGLRFLLGALVVLTMIVCVRRSALAELTKREPGGARELLGAGVLLGVVLSASISFQQIGLQYTKVANAGFISSLYVVLVPLLGVLFRHRTGFGTWLGATLAAIGMYFLSVNEHFSILYGDWYQLAGALVISVQMMLVGRFALRHDTLMLALVQFVTCGLVCLAIGLVIEPVSLAVIERAAPTILYGGALSVGVAYTIQVVAQKYAAPAHAAVIFSMEGVFAALAGWLVLGETLTTRALFGCALMLAGLIVCQVMPAPRRGSERDRLPHEA
ncbi:MULTISPECIES: DMT family transporter [Paraburkholderia]|uniref:DMT family transporter n=1 Tax=Paraburkholderia TaxID=1822464 RepID=UPI00225B8880|nr:MULTISPECIES: DMT family transporter [Paraburkholderia]MCX4159363.1 DMT family transporter [Paraburkholderia aspalathi]MDN7168762.1 DMT family transporter [Paraburkholderia sp. SECH2]MDQ6397249.1 DMT family transporter [Paraburkholderia aspalathi]